MPLTKRLVYIRDFEPEAIKLMKTYGKTELYSTGITSFDSYLGGGFGRPDGYEIVLLYGPSGVGKSTIALNLMAPAIMSGRKVGMLILEDDMPDALNRLRQIMNEKDYIKMLESDNVLCLPADALLKSWSLPDLLEYLEQWYAKNNVDLVLLDHLQFAFENADSIKGENEYVAHRQFMQKLNQLMKRVKKTVIVISHMNKANGSKGMDRIMGSSSISQASTKVIEVMDGDRPGMLEVTMHKSRFTKKPGFTLEVIMENGILRPAKFS